MARNVYYIGLGCHSAVLAGLYKIWPSNPPPGYVCIDMVADQVGIWEADVTVTTALQAKMREKCGKLWRKNLSCVKSVTEGKASILIRLDG